MSARMVADVGERAARWLKRENGTDKLQHVMQAVVKPLEELAEVLAELRVGDHTAAALECGDLIISVRTAQAALGFRDRPLPAVKAVGDPVQAKDDLVYEVAGLGGLAIAWMGQNPRKRARGEVLPVDSVIHHLDLVALKAARLIAALGCDVDDTLAITAAKVHARFDQMGVPR